MKTKLFTIALFFIALFSFSQTEKRIQGKVLNNNLPLQGIEIGNLSTRNNTITNSNGEFTILAKVGDELIFVSKDYEFKKWIVEKETITKGSLTIVLNKKPEQLTEVTITKNNANVIDYSSIKDKKYMDDAQTSPKNRLMNGQPIENGVDFVRIFNDIKRLFKNNKSDAENKKPKIDFKEYTTLNYDEAFFSKTLKLKPEEINLFLEFCMTDSKSKTIAESDNVMAVMDFLIEKNVEFKKL